MAVGRKTGGRKKGTQNKFTLSVKDSVLKTFGNLGGVKHMTTWAKENPTEFYKIAAKLIPTEITGKDGSPLGWTGLTIVAPQ